MYYLLLPFLKENYTQTGQQQCFFDHNVNHYSLCIICRWCAINRFPFERRSCVLGAEFNLPGCLFNRDNFMFDHPGKLLNLILSQTFIHFALAYYLLKERVFSWLLLLAGSHVDSFSSFGYWMDIKCYVWDRIWKWISHISSFSC